jgi:hypothetical protein
VDDCIKYFLGYLIQGKQKLSERGKLRLRFSVPKYIYIYIYIYKIELCLIEKIKIIILNNFFKKINFYIFKIKNVR